MTAAGRYLALDLGGTKLAVRTAGDGADRDDVVPWGSDGNLAADVAVLRTAVGEARARLGGRVDGCAVACAPTLDRGGTVVTWPSRPWWQGLPLVAEISAVAGAPVATADDGSLAALAEAEAAGCADLLYIGIGTGVGGGIVSGGRLVLGASGCAGEIGHLVVLPGGPVCRCGRRGCLQALVCAGALARHAERLRGAATTPEQLASATAAADDWAVQTLWHAAGHLAVAVAAVGEMLDPSRVHIGGGLGSALDALPGMVEQRLDELRRPGHPPPAVRATGLGAGASLAGAMLLARGAASSPPAVVGGAV